MIVVCVSRKEAMLPVSSAPVVAADSPLVALDDRLGKLVLFGLGGALPASARNGEVGGLVFVFASCVGLGASMA